MVNNFISLHCLSRKELDTLIEHELQLMLAEGFDKSPISAKALHIRLKAKGIVNGGLSTLSSLERKRLIAAYVDQQLGPLKFGSYTSRHNAGYNFRQRAWTISFRHSVYCLPSQISPTVSWRN